MGPKNRLWAVVTSFRQARDRPAGGAAVTCYVAKSPGGSPWEDGEMGGAFSLL